MTWGAGRRMMFAGSSLLNSVPINSNVVEKGWLASGLELSSTTSVRRMIVSLICEATLCAVAPTTSSNMSSWKTSKSNGSHCSSWSSLRPCARHYTSGVGTVFSCRCRLNS